MKQSLYQEFYKLLHRKMTYTAPLIVIGFMIVIKLALGSEESQLLGMTNYAAGQSILLVLVIVGTSLFSMEYQSNIMLTLIFKSPSKLNVYLSKVIVIICYSTALHALAILFTFLLQLTPLKLDVSWLTLYQNNQSLLVNMMSLNIVDSITSLLIISLIVSTSCFIQQTSVVVSLNVLIVFMGQFVSTRLLLNQVSLSHLLKWNPLNMINLSQQYYNYEMYHQTTQLSNIQLLIGTMCYSICFILIGYIVFRKKRF